MSTFESEDFKWRETYFVLFESSRRPSLDTVAQTLRRLSDRFEIREMGSDENGAFDSLTLLAPDDYAALDISYIDGEDVIDQARQLAKEMKNSSLYGNDVAKLARLPKCNARFDIMHFEQVFGDGGEEEGDEMLDPSALLLVVDALADLTGGIGIDPQSGALM